jgi:hypothetical protein
MLSGAIPENVASLIPPGGLVAQGNFGEVRVSPPSRKVTRDNFIKIRCSPPPRKVARDRFVEIRVVPPRTVARDNFVELCVSPHSRKVVRGNSFSFWNLIEMGPLHCSPDSPGCQVPNRMIVRLNRNVKNIRFWDRQDLLDSAGLGTFTQA